MKKRITVVLEYENEDETDVLNLDRFIIDDLETELNCCSHFFEIKSIDIEEDKMADWREDYSDRFDELRKHRVELSHEKYGSVRKNYRQGNINALASMQNCVKKYLETGNTEYLCDGANYLMFEFMFPQVPGAHFRATDSNESAGIVGISEKEMEDIRKEDF